MSLPGSASGADCVSTRAGHHARPRHTGGRPAPVSAVGAAGRPAAGLDRDALVGPADADGGVLAVAPAAWSACCCGSRCRQLRSRPTVVCFFRDVPAAHLVPPPSGPRDDPSRRSSWAGASTRRYAITRLPGHPTGLPDWTVWVFVVNVAYAIGAVGAAGRPSTRGRVTHRPAPHQRARRGNRDRCGRGSGRRGGLLAQPGRGLFRHAHAHGAVAGVSRRAGVVCLRHPAPSPVRPEPHRPTGRALRAGAAAVCRADPGARRAAAGRRPAAPQRAAAGGAADRAGGGTRWSAPR